MNLFDDINKYQEDRKELLVNWSQEDDPETQKVCPVCFVMVYEGHKKNHQTWHELCRSGPLGAPIDMLMPLW
jgi:ABC-type sulfate transport system substrate-binding protein